MSLRLLLGVALALGACNLPPSSDDALAGAAGTGGASAGGSDSAGSGGLGGLGGLGGKGAGLGGANAGSAGAPSGGTGVAGNVALAGSAGTAAGNAGGGRVGTGGDAAGRGGAAGGPAAGTAGQAGASAGAGGATGGAAGSSGAGGSQNGGSGATENITLWIAGDSTVQNANTCPIGWGQEFKAYFNERVSVTNSAVGGRSVRTWLYNVGTEMDNDGECVLATGADGKPTLQSRWQAMLDGMKTGDFLFIQFGINDGSATCDRHVGLDAFKESYGMMAAAAKERGTVPVFVTPVSAISCNGSTARGTRGGYVTATLEAGEQYDVAVIDLHELSVALYSELGFCPIPGGSDVSASTPGEVGAFFCDDHTHFDEPGAIRIAELVADAVRDQGLTLAAYLK